MHSLEYTHVVKGKIKPMDKQLETIINTKLNRFTLVLALCQEQVYGRKKIMPVNSLMVHDMKLRILWS